MTQSFRERFEKFVFPEPNSGCWLWDGALIHSGYGTFSVNNRRRLAHRVSYEMEKGTIPAGLEIDHLCRLRSCVNPAHLEAVTPSQNVRRSLSPAALNAKRIECPQGHSLSGNNVELLKGKWRICRRCRVDRNRRRRHQKTERLRCEASP